MDNNVKKIDNIKYQVKQLIQDNLYREVTPETKHNISGIYMIYIDNFTSEKIVPIYIGQAKDIQRRYKQHFSEILALNRLSYDEYHKYFFSRTSSFYDGKYKACKIFKYMIENNCTLQDFRLVILEEVELENLDKKEQKYLLDEKEQEYFQRLLPSFFGFNQLNSHLYQLSFRLSKSQMINSEIDEYLKILLEDIKGIKSYYEYGFTRFNFEYSLPRNINYLLEKKEELNYDTLIKYYEVKSSLDELFKLYNLDGEISEIQRLNEMESKTFEDYKIAKAVYDEGLNQQEKGVIQKIKQKIGVFDKKNDKLQIEKNNKFELFLHADMLRKESLKEMNHKRYKLIFPSYEFGSFSLKDRSDNLSIKMNEDKDLLNTCHIKIYISNNGNSRSEFIRKDPNIIRIDYCFIDNEGKKLEKKYYIKNETTKNCQSQMEYIEKDFMFPFNAQRFNISCVIDNEIDNSFISTKAEYKHGINDYTIKGKKLIKLSAVLDEIQQLTDEETQFNIVPSESYNCLKMCMINEGLKNNPFVEKLATNKLSKIKKRKKSKDAKKVVDKPSEDKVDSKVKRAETFKQKVLIKSNNNVDVLNYVSSREKATAHCTSCGHKWEIRSDHLLARPYCPLCRKMTTDNLKERLDTLF
ncbi:excinuclease ABC subunit C [Neobacillus sp. LXY-1]|uniref:excinuclease ABC subunit C n=1 Tax=Neobacillus sp. LXY-1 TaxID=3379133 RepID=UPI003EE0EE68